MFYSMSRLSLALCLVACHLFAAHGTDGTPQAAVAEDVEPQPLTLEALVDALNVSDGKSYVVAGERELQKVAAQLLPILAVVPKSSAGKYDAPVVCYALHRHFVRQYGWHFQGLHPQGKAWKTLSPSKAVIFRERPEAFKNLLEHRLATGGLLTSEVVLLAVVMELLLHAEAADGLELLLKMFNLPTGGSVLTQRAAMTVIDVYLSSLISGLDLKTSNSTDVERAHGDIDEAFPIWKDMKTFSHDSVRSQWPGSLRGKRVALPEVIRQFEQLHHGLGPWQNRMCSSLKTELLKIEDQAHGYVRLSAFYKASLNGTYQFGENVAYLRQLGALDESSPGNPRIIMPNWINGPSNCIGTFRSHDVCCISQCEPLLQRVEREIAAPVATPTKIAEVVATLADVSSGSESGERSLTPLLLQRLHAIAAVNDGVVPIYGRLFAQWMHIAFPRECPYPHLSGKTQPVNIYRFADKTPDAYFAETTEMKEYAGRRQRRNEPMHSAPWVNEEELFVRPSVDSSPVLGLKVIHFSVALVALFIMIMGLARTLVRAARHALLVGLGGGSKLGSEEVSSCSPPGPKKQKAKAEGRAETLSEPALQCE